MKSASAAPGAVQALRARSGGKPLGCVRMSGVLATAPNHLQFHPASTNRGKRSKNYDQSDRKSYAMAKPDGKKRDKTDIAAAAAKGRKSVAKAVHKDIARAESRPTGSGEQNSYLAAVLNPKTFGKGQGVPDDETFPSVKFQTSLVDTLEADAFGNVLGAHAPCFTFGGYHPVLFYASGATAQSNNPTILSLSNEQTGGGTLTLPPLSTLAFTGGIVENLVPAQTMAAIQQSFAAMRPVSMESSFVPTEALLNAQGALYAGIASREQAVGSGSAADCGGPLGLQVLGNPIHLGPDDLPGGEMEAVKDLESLVSGAQFSGNVTKPVKLIWRFEDNQDFVYRTVESSSHQVGGGLLPPDLDNYNTESTFCSPVAINQSYAVPPGPPSNVAWVWPGGIQADADIGVAGPGATLGNVTRLANWTYPWTFWAVRGATPGAQIGQVTHTINWEAIPLTGSQSIMATTPSPNNPMELAQAGNVLPQVPPAYDPSNASAPESKVFTAALKSTGDLYDGKTGPKAAVEGKSFAARLGSGLLKGAATILPFPLSAVATGAEMLLNGITGG